MMTRAYALAIVGCLLAPALAVAQDAADAAVPAEVLSILMRIGAIGAPGGGDLRTGPAPADFPVAVFPAGSHVVATVVSTARGTTVVAAAPELNASDLWTHEAALLSAGWTEIGPHPRGFVMTSMAAITVCRDLDLVTLSSSPRAEGGSYVRATDVHDPRRPCVKSPAFALADVDVPLLTPPDGVRLSGASGGGSLDALTSASRAIGQTTARALSDHFESQLVAHGWKATGHARVRDDLIVTTFSLASRSGDPLTASLTVTALGASGDFDLFLRLVRDTRDPRDIDPRSATTTTFERR